MAIEGPLRELGIHDVLQLLDLSRKTGRLRVSSALRDNEGVVIFRNGRVVEATIRSNPHPLGALLLQAGRITEDELARARAAQQEAGEHRRLGQILIAQGAITGRDLARCVRQQIETVVFELLAWQEGFFSFVEDDIGDAGADGIAALPTESLLMEGARRLDEWAQVQQLVPHLGMVPDLADPPVDGPAPVLDLLPNEWEVLAMIDGTRDFRSIATGLGRSEFDVGKIAFGLVATGIVVLHDPSTNGAGVTSAQLAACVADARDALATERSEDALSHAAAAVSLAPDDADARTTLARVLTRLGRDVEAAEELRLALEADPGHAPALMEAARLAARRGELAHAIGLWQRIVTACPSTPIAEQARDAMAHATRLTAVLEAVDG